MKNAILFAALVAASAASAASQVVADFSKGCPDGFSPRRGAAITAGSLVRGPESSPSVPSGCISAEPFTYAEAFRFEVEFTTSPYSNAYSPETCVWDNMYIREGPRQSNRGMQVTLHRRRNEWTPTLYLGFSNTTVRVSGPTLVLKEQRPLKFAFLYDGNRRIAWDFDGMETESFIKQTGALCPSDHKAVIGDRVASNYCPIEGAIQKLSITPVPRQPFGIHAEGRLAFERAETDAMVTFRIDNPFPVTATGCRAVVLQTNESKDKIKTTTVDIGDLAPGADKVFSIPVQTRVKTGTVFFDVGVKGTTPNGEVKMAERVKAKVGPTFAARMPAISWEFDASNDVLADYGFTHGFPRRVFNEVYVGEKTIYDGTKALDDALATGVRLMRRVPAICPPGKPEKTYWRCDRKGQLPKFETKPTLEAGHPDMLRHARYVASSLAKAYCSHPAFAGVLACTETRDHVYPSFNTEHLRYKEETGHEVPSRASYKWFYFPLVREKYPDGVVPDDYPILSYYRWFWHGGDGWPRYASAIADGFRKYAGSYGDGSEKQKKHPFFSLFDPAVRCPPVWGSGGNVDVLNQWVYAVPEPMSVAGPLEELFAMASGHPGQQVMIMTQLICYRSQTAPTNVVVESAPQWLNKFPNAGFIAIPPDSLQEATWSMLAKPVKGVMFYGWGCVYDSGQTTGYCFTNPETATRMKSLLKDVIAPLGPTLLDLGRADSPVAILESGTTCVLGGPASWGWTAPSVTFLQRARLDPRVIYDEGIARDGLDGVKVLYAPQCWALPASVVEKIRKFQADGGILVGDEQTMKGLKPDVVAPLVSFNAPPASDHTEDIDAMEAAKGGDAKKRVATVLAKKKMLRQAEDIRKALAAKGYAPEVDSSTPEIVVYSRRWKDVPYVFAVNDKRTFGDYIGQWGLTMEKGVPCKGEVSIADSEKRTGAVYELSRGKAVKFTRDASGRVVVPVSFDTNDGRIFAFLREPIAGVSLSAKISPSGDAMDIAFSVKGKSGKLVQGRLPVEIRIFDASGRELDGAGWACAVDGVCSRSVPLNVDDPKGGYTIRARDIASGLKTVKSVEH